MTHYYLIHSIYCFGDVIHLNYSTRRLQYFMIPVFSLVVRYFINLKIYVES